MDKGERDSGTPTVVLATPEPLYGMPRESVLFLLTHLLQRWQESNLPYRDCWADVPFTQPSKALPVPLTVGMILWPVVNFKPTLFPTQLQKPYI
ncbi:hypothetical protein EVAR_101445_1 [Eumeta japonica]|uniref:Uncharacterized protein n=1 Tax=Eumeta variegata TaxID=151549 RepID=A0A4C1TB92_EUMVA|nr:hypothetical protein EVAR_101445_1 [Eumeta japonica]